MESAAAPVHSRGGNDSNGDDLKGLTEDDDYGVGVKGGNNEAEDNQSRTLPSQRDDEAQDGDELIIHAGESVIHTNGRGSFSYPNDDDDDESTDTTSQCLKLVYPDGSKEVHDSRGESVHPLLPSPPQARRLLLQHATSHQLNNRCSKTSPRGWKEVQSSTIQQWLAERAPAAMG